MNHRRLSEDFDECDEQRADALLEISAQSLSDTHRSDWAVAVRWIVAFSVIAWVIVLAAVLLASRRLH